MNNLTDGELLEVFSFKLAETVYKLLGILLLRRECYVVTCACEGRENHLYHPYQGAFIWEVSYWLPFHRVCNYCSTEMNVSRKYDGLAGALYRLPCYKELDSRRLRVAYLRAPSQMQVEWRRAALRAEIELDE